MSDESKFELFRGNGRRWVWRRPHEKYDVDCLIPTMKPEQDGVMVWGCFTRDGLGPLVRLNGKIIAKNYINLLKNYLVPYINPDMNVFGMNWKEVFGPMTPCQKIRKS